MERLTDNRTVAGSYVLDQVNAMLAYWNAEEVCLYANNAYNKWFGLTGEKMRGITLKQLLGEELYERNKVYIRGVLSGRKQTFERELVTTKGQTTHHILTFNPDIFEGSVRGFVVEIADVTELKNKEIALQESELKFKGLLESAPDAMVLTDSSGIIQLTNTRCEEMFGHTSEELAGQSAEMLLPAAYKNIHPDKFGEFVSVLKSKQICTLILKGSRKNGKEFPVEVSFNHFYTGGEMLIVAAFRDITWKVEKERELLRSHEETKKKARQIENILGAISDCFFVADNNWTFTYWNRAAEKTLGKKREEVIGSILWESFPESIGTNLENEYRRAAITQVPTNFDFSHPNGMWFNISAYPSPDGLTVYFTDITERKKHEDELSRVKNNQLALINATKDMIWSIDTEYRLITANKSYHNRVLSLSGYEIKEGDCVINRPETGEIVEQWKEYYDRSLRGETYSLVENRFGYFEIYFAPIFDANNKITGVACYSKDVSDRIKVENEKMQKEQWFTTLVQNGSDLIAIADEKLAFKYVSPSIYSQLAFIPGQLAGTSPVDSVHPQDQALVIKALSDLRMLKEIKLPAIRFLDGNGNYRWLEATITNLLDDPAVNGIVANARDVTDRKMREVERENMINELTRSNNDLKQFSFITSHNLRAPLSNIKGLLNLFDYSLIDPVSKDLLQMIEKSTRQLSETIQDITEIVVIKNNVNTPVAEINVEDVFKQVNRNFINTENDIAAQIFFDFKVPRVYFNRTYLESIFINLVSNSIKYRKPNCTLKITISTENVNNQTLLTFSDNGIGIDLARHRDRVFGMYQRFHSHVDGQGIGLFIVKSQIEALGATIAVESEVDHGTTFIIAFPNKKF